MADEATLGPNEWLVDEMYDQYRQDPSSVSESWREFFADYHPNGNGTALAPPAAAPADVATPTPAAPAPPATPAPAPAAAPKPAAAAAPAPASPATSDGGELLRGAAARIVTNMEASLAVPTATSF